MPVLYNFQKGHAEYLPDEQVQQAVSTGTHGFRKGVEVRVLDPDGKAHYIPSENAQKALSGMGYTYQGNAEAQAEMRAEIERQKAETFDNPLSAAAAGTLGAVRTATFGLSDVAIRGIYGETGAEATRELAEAQPTATLVGELAGGLVPGAGVAGVGLRGAARVGQAVTKATESGLGLARANSLLGKAMSQGAGMAAEGALYGSGQAISQAALMDPQFNAQTAVSTIGLSGLVGGALGGASQPAIKLMQKGKRALTQLSESIPVIAEKTASNTFNVTDKAIERLGPAYTKVLGAFRPFGDDAEDIARAFAPANAEGRATIRRYMDNPVAAAEDAAVSLKNVVREGGQAARESMGARKAVHEEIAKRMPRMTKEVETDFMDTLQDVAMTIDEVRKKPYRYNQGLVNQLEDFVNETVELALDARKKTIKLKQKITPAKAHQIAHKLRGDFDDYLYNNAGDLTGAAKATQKLVKRSRDKINSHIRSEKIYGDAAKQWKAFDKAYSDYQNVLQRLKKPLLKKVVGDEGQDVFISGKGGGGFLVDSNKVKSFVNNPENIRGKEFRGVVETLKQRIVEMRRAADDFAERFAIPKSEETIEKLDELLSQVTTIEQARAAILAINRVESQTGKSVIPTLVGMSAGGLAGGAAGQAVGALGGAALANPRMMFRYISEYEAKRAAGMGGLQSAVEAFLNTGSRTAETVGKAVKSTQKRLKGAGVGLKTAGKVGIAEAAQMFSTSDVEDNRKTDIERLKENVTRYISNPVHADNQLNAAYPLMHEAMPEEYAAWNGVAVRAAQFLNSKIPNSRTDNIIPGTITLSRSEKLKIEKYIEAVSNPSVIFEQLAVGKISPETVEAIEFVYPEMFAEIQRQVIETVMSSDPRKMPYKQSLQLGVLFKVPTTDSLRYLLQNQQSLSTMVKEDQTNQINRNNQLENVAEQTASGISKALDR